MDQNPQQFMDRPQGKYFTCQKWTLFAYSLFGLLVSIIMLLMAGFIADIVIEMLEKDSAKELNDDKKKEFRLIVITIIIVVSIIGGLLNLIGVLGAYKEHYCLSFTYGIYIALKTVVLLFISMQHSWLWIKTIFSFAISILAFSFAMSIRRSKYQSNQVEVIASEAVDCG